MITDSNVLNIAYHYISVCMCSLLCLVERKGWEKFCSLYLQCNAALQWMKVEAYSTESIVSVVIIVGLRAFLVDICLCPGELAFKLM